MAYSSGEDEENEFQDDDVDDAQHMNGDGGADENDNHHGRDSDDDDNDDDQPLSALGKRSVTKKNVSYAEDDNDDDDDDDDDDVPLASLVQSNDKKKKTNGKASPSKAAPASAKKSTKNGTASAKKSSSSTKTSASSPTKKRKTTTTTSAVAATTSGNAANASSSSKTYEWASAALYGTESTKGLLIQRLLCRWWYAMTWPDPTCASATASSPPSYYDTLDGFPGVFICTTQPHRAQKTHQGTNVMVGHILDRRDRSLAPSFVNMAQKSSQELKDLLLKALQEQKKQLIQHEGKGTPTEKEIDDLIKWTERVNVTKADNEATKVLKAHGLKLS